MLYMRFNASLLCNKFMSAIEMLKAEQTEYSLTYEMKGGRFDLFLENIGAQEQLSDNLPIQPLKADYDNNKSLQIIDYPENTSFLKKLFLLITGIKEPCIKVNYDNGSKILIPVTQNQDGSYQITINSDSSHQELLEYYLECGKKLVYEVIQQLNISTIETDSNIVGFTLQQKLDSEGKQRFQEISKSLCEYISVDPLIQIIGYYYLGPKDFEIIDSSYL